MAMRAQELFPTAYQDIQSIASGDLPVKGMVRENVMFWAALQIRVVSYAGGNGLLSGLAARHDRSSAGNVSLRDYEIRQGESGHGNRPEDKEVSHGQCVAHDEFERGEIPKWR